MSKDAPATPAKQAGVSLFREIVRSKTWRRALLVGALVGLAIGVLDLVAFANEWRLGDFLDALDTPVDLIFDFARNQSESLDDSVSSAWVFFSLFGCTAYWMIISLLLALVYCFARAGGFKRIRRDRTCRRALIFGVGAGIFIGGANFLAMLNEVEILERCFDFLDQPGVALAQAVIDRFGPAQIVPQSLSLEGEGIFMFVAAMAYWMIIGFLPAMLFCVVRVLRMRNEATESRLSAEALPAK